MTGRTRSHSEERWALLPEAIVRCNATRPNGSRCKREAEPGAVVCDQHGGTAPQVRRHAAERLIMTADQAAQMLVTMMADTEVPFGVRAKIAQDLLDRAGLIATQVHQIVPMSEDPIMRFFEEAFSDPNNWEENPPQPAIEERVIDRDAKLVEAEIVEPEGELATDTPPRVAEMIRSGAFDRKPRQ
jgi:hypothetical protein